PNSAICIEPPSWPEAPIDDSILLPRRQAQAAIMADRLCNEQRYERSVTGDVCCWPLRARCPSFDSRPSRRDHRALWAAREPVEDPFPTRPDAPRRRALVGLGRALAIGAAVSPLYLVLFRFPISHNGDLHRVRRHHGSCLDWSRRGRRWGRSHRLRSYPADIILADPTIRIRL